MEKLKNNPILVNSLIYTCFIIMVTGNVLVQKLNELDEIWLYNFARCISDGLLPYKDISMIITPLFPMICSVFLKIFGNELIVMRGLEILECAGILFIIYKIMQRLKINKAVSIISIIRNVFFDT